jgi:[FeFe] hydrogenase H-cluster maturation GTPase HydF
MSSLNATPAAERVHIGIFGRRNAGKSSVINAITGQSLAIVSEIKGTTTDPVFKNMELLPLGPVTLIDTPGLDDEGELGKLRMQKGWQVLNKTDIAVLVIDGVLGMSEADQLILDRFKAKGIPWIVVENKLDAMTDVQKAQPVPAQTIRVSSRSGANIHELKERIAALVPEEAGKRQLVADLIAPSDFVVLVIPIDKAAPKGRLILPQQQVIRDILESGTTAVVCREHEYRDTLSRLGVKPRLVITDSQAFALVAADTPADVVLTSFSILFARYKGDLATTIRGVRALDRLKDGDRVLISEGCTHHRQCNDIGTVKLPDWITDYTGCQLDFSFTSGGEFPDDLSPYQMIVHCGGCMLNAREMRYRYQCAVDQGIPITNYGILIAAVNGILKRTLVPFPEMAALFEH